MASISARTASSTYSAKRALGPWQGWRQSLLRCRLRRRNSLGAAETVLPACTGNDSGTVDAGDYEVWKDNFGQSLTAAISSPATGSAQVPEPATFVLAGTLSGMFALRGCRS